MSSILYYTLTDKDRDFYDKLSKKGLEINDVQILTVFPYTVNNIENTTANVIKILKYIIENDIESSSLYFRRTDDLTYVYPTSDACQFEYNSYFSDTNQINLVLKRFEDIISLYFSDELSLLIASPFKIYINKIEDKYE
jgi:hypothetical protein